MIKTAITVSLVKEAEGGPFVYWHDLPGACAKAAELGFDAVEIFAPHPDAVDDDELKALLETHGLKVAAVGTGGGWVIHKLTLTNADPEIRQKAREFIRAIIDWGAEFNAPAIIGSMQGRFEGDVSKEQALAWLADALEDLGAHAAAKGTQLFYEPLNRYETNLINRTEDGVRLLEGLTTDNVKLLSDVFHMNIEEANIADAFRTGGKHVGHVHFVDSNRRATGMGHMNHTPIAEALREIGYDGYVSAEAFPIPSSDEAAESTIAVCKRLFTS
ncbi:MAG: sugar phosphate isomerase/epimerase [Candidatus Binatia bacterium]|jgi:sugar phosphate isomerase/epimerase